MPPMFVDVTEFLVSKRLDGEHLAGVQKSWIHPAHLIHLCDSPRPGELDAPLLQTWVYPDRGECLRAFAEWDGVGEPTGWVRHFPSNRIRELGTEDGEYVKD